jgi:hypothetical protein
MSKAPRATLVTIGIVAIVLGGLGMWYNVNTLFADYSDLVNQETPYFYHSFYLMSGVCFLCYVGLIACGIQFVRGAVGVVGLFIGILVFESMYLIALGLVWAALTSYLSLGLSVGAATGVANGGLMFQFFILFPLWGSVAAYWARHKLNATTQVAI